MTIDDDVNKLYVHHGAKFVVITDSAIHGYGPTPEAAWQHAIERCSADALGDAQCYNAAPGGAKINDWCNRSMSEAALAVKVQTLERNLSPLGLQTAAMMLLRDIGKAAESAPDPVSGASVIRSIADAACENYHKP